MNEWPLANYSDSLVTNQRRLPKKRKTKPTRRKQAAAGRATQCPANFLLVARNDGLLLECEMSKFPLQEINQEEDGRRLEAAAPLHREEEEGEEEAPPVVRDEEEETEKARCEWDFSLSSSILPPSTSLCGTSDAIGVIEIDPSDTILATGGSARKIRIYTLRPLESRGFHDHASTYDYYICTPAKLSSLRWQPDSGGRVIGSGDYDGVVTEYDLEKRVPVFERDEHGGRRVWSIDYSARFPSVGASASDDGTVHLWDSRSGAGVAVVQPGSMSPVCSVEFDRSDGSTLMAVGSADRCVYVFDLRWPAPEPIAVLRGHRKAVSYVRFLGSGSIVSAGIDGCLKLWDVHAAKVVRTYEGHVNARNFVGLAVWREGGLLGCGSESNEVYVYDRRWKDPIWVRGFEPRPLLGQSGCGGRFVSSVCWRQQTSGECTLVAGGSNGVLQVFTGKKKETWFA
ncbi:WD repeat-containing protein RUP2 [Nymphaea colorata]|nr:WD repeat-containing protein RUP2 [Nymphaea colorata]